MATIKKHVKAIIQLRRATEQEWIDYNPVLRVGEPALSTDKNSLKIGMGKIIGRIFSIFLKENN